MTRVGTPYDNDFMLRAYLPWLGEHPEHLEAAARLRDALESGDRRRIEQEHRHGIQIPETLILGLTSACNLHCTYCCSQDLISGPPATLSPEILRSVMAQCRDLGVHRFVLAGGEPMLAKGIDDLVGNHPDCFFSITTNGRALDDARLRHYQKLANHAFMVNVSSTSLQGPLSRLGADVRESLRNLDRHGLLFGFAVTTHGDNHRLFGDTNTLEQLDDLGTRFGVFFNYLSRLDSKEDRLLLTADQRLRIVEPARAFAQARGRLFIFAPEDEEIMGGCGAAGRQVLALSPHGTIDPCPYVPYSKFHIVKYSLLDALKSDYFMELRHRSREWERRDGSCAYRAAQAEFQNISERHGASHNQRFSNGRHRVSGL